MFWYVIVSDLFLLGFYCFKWCCVSSSYIKSAEYQEEDRDNIYATTTDSKSKNILNDLQAYARNNGTVDSFEGNQEWIILSPLEAGIQKKISKCAIPLKD